MIPIARHRGTSADFALIIDGEPQFGVGEADRDFPLFAVPSVAVSSIGIKGSIATVDGHGVLKVGRRARGRCRGRRSRAGGTLPIVTDAPWWSVAAGAMAWPGGGLTLDASASGPRWRRWLAPARREETAQAIRWT
ncbi:MAG: hydantoinase/oxoprolinase family protein [Amaricoccus sp.]